MFDQKYDEQQDDIEPTGEDKVDEPELEVDEATSKDKLKQLRIKIKELEADKRQHLEDLQRAKADFLNTKRRLEENQARERERLINDHIERLLPLCDSFAMAMSNAAAWEKVDPTWRSGVEGIYQQLRSLLSGYGVTVIEPLNEAFDPERHEAVGQRAAVGTDSETVVEVIQSGYERNGHLIRPAKVIISE